MRKKSAYTYDFLSVPKKKPEPKKIGAALMSGNISAMCAAGKHTGCSASACRCKKCPCEFNP